LKSKEDITKEEAEIPPYICVVPETITLHQVFKIFYNIFMCAKIKKVGKINLTQA